MFSSSGIRMGKVTWTHLRLEALPEQVTQKNNRISIWKYLLEYNWSVEQWHISWVGKEMRTGKRLIDWSVMQTVMSHPDHLSMKELLSQLLGMPQPCCQRLQGLLHSHRERASLHKEVTPLPQWPTFDDWLRQEHKGLAILAELRTTLKDYYSFRTPLWDWPRLSLGLSLLLSLPLYKY